MTLATFFKKFDQFGDAPNAVAKMRNFSSAKGAPHTSLGQRPSNTAPHIFPAPTGRPTR